MQVTKVALSLFAACLLFPVRGAEAQELNFFKNYFVTGGYVVGSKDLLPQDSVGGMVSGTIPMTGVPLNADILAAFLYWETITDGVPTSVAATFRGQAIGDFAVRIGELNASTSASPCWTNGQGGQGNGNLVINHYRADVMRFLPIGNTPSAPNYRKRLVNDTDLTAHGFPASTVSLADAGNGNHAPASPGVSLVVIYRKDPLDPAGDPLTGIVLYEGFRGKGATETMTQVLKGFYQRAPGATARLTQLVSSGQPNATEQFSFNGSSVPATNPFNSSPSSQRGWTGLTFTNLDMSSTGAPTQYGEEVTTSVWHTDGGSDECLAWTAFVFSVPVKDTDRDGLLNIWEGDPVTSLVDPDDEPLPNLYAMRARHNVQDIFVELGFMQAAPNTTYGPLNGSGQCIAPACDADLDGHTHLPSLEALNQVATAFRGAFSPRAGGVSGPINIHFDVGSNYQSGLPSDATCLSSNPNAWVPGCAIIPASMARGGESIPEIACQPGPNCSLSTHPGSVSWKTGYRLIREQPLNYGTEAECATHADCERRFDYSRRHAFRYALFAHALAVPMSSTDDPTTPYDERSTPVRTSGIADLPGGDMMVTLGRWDDFTGTTFMQASTLMHEFGHSAGLRHGGMIGQPNCKPNYLTVMNYLFQARGLFTYSGNTSSDPIVDYSRQQLPSLQETGLFEAAGLGAMAYATRWYAPWGSSLIDTELSTSPTKRHCDGSPLSPEELADATATVPGPLAMARVDGTTLSGPIDWNGDGTADDVNLAQDISFSGSKTVLDAGVNDWAILDLRQVGSRRNVAGNSAGTLEGGLSVDMRFSDMLGLLVDTSGLLVDTSGLENTGLLVDTSGLLVDTSGLLVDTSGLLVDTSGLLVDTSGDAGLGAGGQGDVVPDAPGAPRGDLNLETAVGFGNAPHIQRLNWNRQARTVTVTVRRPHAGKVLSYEAYRMDGGLPVTAAQIAQRVHVGTPWPFPAGTTPTVDIVDNVQNNRTYTYFVLAIMENPDGPSLPVVRSGISTYRVISTKQ